MPEFCTCGAQLPPDALFCHKCGKPQREIDTPEPETPVDVEFVPPPRPPEAPPLNFHNKVAVRIGLLIAVSATILSFLPFLNWLAGGFFAVFFYRRKTGSLLNVSAGVRLGWITGLMTFGLAAIVFTAEQLPAALSGHLASSLQQQMKNLPAQDPAVMQQMSRFFESGAGVAMVLLFSLAGLFVFITCLSMAGGALGAKFVGRE